MELTIADGVVALILLVSAMLAYNRGVTREVMAIGGWIAAAFIAFYFAPMISPLLEEIPYVGDFLRSSCTLSALAGFVAAFAGALLVLSIFTPLLSSAVQSTALGPIDKALGFLFGIARGVLLVAVVYLLYNLVITDSERIAMIENSASISVISDAAMALEAQAPTSVPDWLQSRIDGMLGNCGAETPPQAALSVLRPFA
jgi:membrane protein required for colicin V production